MKTLSYNRSEIYSYFDLTEDQQQYVLSTYADDLSEAESESYVLFGANHEVLPLSMFMRLEHSNIWHGVYGTSYFSAYFIRLDRSNTFALIAEKYC